MRDDSELRALYAEARPRLVVQLAALTGDFGVAEDAVQEAFARAVGRWSTVRDYDSPEAWVHAVAANIARSRWHKAQHAVSFRLRLGAARSTPELSPDHVALLAALRKLPVDQHTAIVLHHLVDLSVDEVALRTGVPAGTVKARLSRGRHALAQLLGDDAEDNALKVRRDG